MSQIHTHKYLVDDIHLNVAEIGSGPSLILIHGWSNCWIGWTPLAHQLASTYHIYMIDLPGFGDSDHLHTYSVANISTYLNTFITNHCDKPQAIIGASLGTLIAAYTLDHYPSLAPSLILLGAVFNQNSLKHASRYLMKLLSYANKTRPTQLAVEKTIQSRYTAYLVEMFLNAYQFDKHQVDKYGVPGRRKVTGKSYIEVGLSASQIDLKTILAHTTKPTLLIYGEAEKYTPITTAKKIVDSLNNPQLQLQVIPRAGHNPAYEQPLATTSIISSVISSQQSSW